MSKNTTQKITDPIQANEMEHISEADLAKHQDCDQKLDSTIEVANPPDSSADATSTSELENEPTDVYRNEPLLDPACLYGLVGDIAHAGSNNTEASPYAVAASALAYLGAALGGGPYFPIGDDFQHTRLFFIHVGRSGLGRKGTAKKLIYRIHEALKQIDEMLTPQVHNGGLSTREGLALLIHDGFKDGKIKVPPIDDKRLLVIESEFSNVLQQSKRDGNTLSGGLRDAWDGTSIKPAVKNSPVWASDPHISFIGDVTPSELRELMPQRELTNGFANRFVFFWSESEKLVPFPKPTDTQVIESLANRVAQVLRFAGADRQKEKNTIRIDFSPGAASLYESWYLGELRDRSAGEHITALLERRAAMLLRLAMLFALTDQNHVINVNHLNAAMAWVRYWVDSVRFIFQGSVTVTGAAKVTTIADRITAYLAENGETSRTNLSKNCFNGHIYKATLDKALDQLILANPPVIEVKTVPRTNGQPGSPSKLYKLCESPTCLPIAANRANSEECAAPRGLETDLEPTRTLQNERTVVAPPVGLLADFAQFAKTEAMQSQTPSSMGIVTSLSSPTLVENMVVIDVDEL